MSPPWWLRQTDTYRNLLLLPYCIIAQVKIIPMLSKVSVRKFNLKGSGWLNGKTGTIITAGITAKISFMPTSMLFIKVTSCDDH